MNKVNRKVLNMVYAAVFAAMIFALTRFIQIPVPGGAGYLHFGDAMIYIVASTLGGPMGRFLLLLWVRRLPICHQVMLRFMLL